MEVGGEVKGPFPGEARGLIAATVGNEVPDAAPRAEVSAKLEIQLMSVSFGLLHWI